MNYPTASSGVSISSPSLSRRHSGLDLACPVLDTGESSLLFWAPAGVYPDENRGWSDDSRGKTPIDSIFSQLQPLFLISYFGRLGLFRINPSGTLHPDFVPRFYIVSFIISKNVSVTGSINSGSLIWASNSVNGIDGLRFAFKESIKARFPSGHQWARFCLSG